MASASAADSGVFGEGSPTWTTSDLWRAYPVLLNGGPQADIFWKARTAAEYQMKCMLSGVEPLDVLVRTFDVWK